MAQEKVKVAEKHSVKTNKFRLSSGIWLIVVATSLAIGYFAGTNHFQIEATVGPLFGYNAHSGNIDLSSLQQTYNSLAGSYDGNLDVNKLIQGANKGLVDAAGDTYTVYMTPNEASSYNNNLSGNIGGGIGAEIGTRNGKITIIRTLENNPAIKAGLSANDVILSINDQSTSGMSVEQAVSLIRGDAGTTVKLVIQRGDEEKTFTITRAVISNPSVTSSVTNGIGTLTISRFDSETGNLASAAAQTFVNKGVKGVILDLRGNGGGYVDAAGDVAGLWLANKVVVTERSGNNIKNTVTTNDNAPLKGIPTVVLVNGATASASEIVAGALQDYKAAKIVGEQTFGKGSVQELVPLNNGAQLKVTVAKWYTPNGKNITKNGITPDVKAGLSQSDIDKGIDPQLEAAKKLLGA